MKEIDTVVLLGFVFSFTLILIMAPLPASRDGLKPAHFENPRQPETWEKTAVKAVETSRVLWKQAQREIAVLGKIGYDEESLSGISSPIAGRTVEIKVGLGQQISRGDILLTIDNADLGPISRPVSGEAPQARSRFYLKSPLSGTIVEKNVTLGQTVGPDPTQSLFTIADLSMVAVTGEIDESDLSGLEVDQPISVTVDAYPDQVFHGTIASIGGSIDSFKRTVKIVGRIKNPGRQLKPEMRATFSIEADDPDEETTILQTVLFDQEQPSPTGRALCPEVRAMTF